MLTRLVVVLLLAAPLAAEPQNPIKSVRIGWLGLASPGPEVMHIVDGFKQGLREVGYVEGQNVAFEYRWAHGHSERLPQLAAELVHLKVDMIAVASTPGVLAAKRATSAIPIISLGPDPQALGLGSRLARPGGNITGTTLVAGPEIGGQYLQLLKEARSSKIQLQPVTARTPDDLDAAFSAMARPRADAVIVLADPIFLLHRQRIADLAAKSRLPAMYGLAEHAEGRGSWPTRRTSRTWPGVRPPMLTGSSRARGLATCRSSNRRGSN